MRVPAYLIFSRMEDRSCARRTSLKPGECEVRWLPLLLWATTLLAIIAVRARYL